MSTEVVAKEFGKFLQTCRRSVGASLEDISRKTKITPGILQQIENENLGSLPAPTFVKGFIKAYAEAVGADPEEAVHRFENVSACRGQECLIQAPSPKRSSGGSWYPLALAMVLLFAQIGATLYFAQIMQGPSSLAPSLSKSASETLPPAVSELVIVSAIKVATKPETMVGSQSDTTPTVFSEAVNEETMRPLETPEPESDKPLQATSAAAPNFKLRMTAVEPTWLKVVSDDNAPKEFILQMNQDVTMVARNGFDLIIGNAGGIRLMLNEKPIPISGNRGQVVDIHLP